MSSDEKKSLRDWRMEKRLTQKELSERAGINIRQIQRMETGEIQMDNITLATARKLAKVLGIGLDSL